MENVKTRCGLVGVRRFPENKDIRDTLEPKWGHLGDTFKFVLKLEGKGGQ